VLGLLKLIVSSEEDQSESEIVVRQSPHVRGVRGGEGPAVGSRCIAMPSKDIEKTSSCHSQL
jgi:hypothetical protein